MKKLSVILCFVLILTTSSCAKKESAARQPAQTGISKNVQNREKTEKKAARLTVIIDPGHGFSDPGSTPEYFCGTEADVTLAASLELKKVLEKRGIPCVLTHNGEKYIDEDELAGVADSLKIEYDAEQLKEDGKFSPYERSVYENVLSKRFPNCFFVSLHTNAVEYAPEVCGASIDWYSGNPYSVKLENFASDLARYLESSPGTTLKIFEDSYDDAYIVTKHASIPSVLIELGYGTNAAEAAKLQNSVWINKFAASVADAIEEWGQK